MISQLEQIINLLETKVTQETKLAFEMNIAAIVFQLEEELRQAGQLFTAVRTTGSISSDETSKIQEMCRAILNSYYSFGERIDNICNTVFKTNGIKVNASYPTIDQDLKKARGTTTHIMEPLYSFKQSDNTVSSCTANTFYSPYKGECYDIEISFKENDGTVSYRTTYEGLIKDVRSSVVHILDKLFNRLNNLL